MKFVIEINSNEITKDKIASILEDYFEASYLDGDLSEEPSFTVSELTNKD